MSVKNQTDLDVWEIIKAMMSDYNNKHLIKHHLDSFNDFIDNKISYIINQTNPLSIYHDYNIDSNNYKYEIVINFINNYLVSPSINENNGSVKMMFPSEARIRNMSYCSNLYIDINIDIFIHPMEDTRERISSKIIKGINIGSIPIMVYSKYCNLYNIKDKSILEQECEYDIGGYFIINGNEKVIVSQEKIAENKVFVFEAKKNSSKYSHIVDIKSCKTTGLNVAKNLSIKLLSKENKYGHTLKVTMPHVKIDIPLFVLFRALGVLEDKKIIEYIVLDIERIKDEDRGIFSWLRPSIEEGSFINSQNDALEYILKNAVILGQPKDIRLSTERKIELFKGMMGRDLLSHVGECFNKKALFVGYMVKKLYLCIHKRLEFDDRDSYCNKRVDTSGYLMAILFRQYFNKFIKDSRNSIMKELNSGPWKTNDNIDKVINQTNVYKIFKSTTIGSGLKYGLSTGNWGLKTPNIKVGVAQVLSRMTYNSTLSHLRRINTPTEKTGKLIPPRKLHNTQWGIICPPETPEGQSIGLVKNMAISCYITNQTSIEPILKVLNRYIISIDSIEDRLSLLYNKTKIIINGEWIGISEQALELYSILKSNKRKGIINIYTSISFDYTINEINIYTDSGRCCRPLLVVKNNNITINQNDIENLKNKNYSWLNLLVGSLNTKNIKSMADVSKHITEGVIEYVDTLESIHSMTAINKECLSKTNKIRYEYCEIHPSLIMGVLSSCIPFSNHNQSPRNTYQSAMGKQAMGIHAKNYKQRMDTMAHILHYPHKPIVNTRIGTYLPSHNLPNGMNIIVAIGSFTGYNQEDSVILNQSSIDRGLFRSTFYRTYKDDEKKMPSSGQEEQFTKPDRNVKGLKPGSYEKLNSNGFVPNNTYVDTNDIIIGKVSPIKGKKKDVELYKDSSTILRPNESGFIDKVVVNSNGEGNTFCKVRVRSERKPKIGDKFSSRHGQKGTVGMVYNQEDMPFNKDGICPDIIVNPHAIPSRMTIAQLMECIMGKACTMLGGYGDASPFGNVSVEDIGKVLTEKCGMERHGNEILYNGQTGVQMNVSFFMGPTYYQRLKHMVEDKIHSRATGPKVLLTRQPPEGRSRDGGLRFGEMERDCMISHGTMQFLKERTMDVSDNYSMFICNMCHSVASVNYEDNISKCKSCKNYIDFSQVRIPYACKLLIQELESMSIAPRIIT